MCRMILSHEDKQNAVTVENHWKGKAAKILTDCAEDHTNEKSAPEQGTLGPPEDSEEHKNGGPSAVKLPSGISNTGPCQSSEPHEQEGASKVAPDSDLALLMNYLSQQKKIVAEEDQSNLGKLWYSHAMQVVTRANPILSPGCLGLLGQWGVRGHFL
ncbi:hypothetical protein F4604DRAFT_1687217 [Suillus subluteus]|nr:hypothetical protein F4604DRAFT_1687217 [Suillus subluteus]